MRRTSKFLGLMSALMLAAGAAWADGHTSGEAMLEVKNMRSKTIVIGEHTYKVTDRTAITDLEGRRISLRQLPVPKVGSKDPLRQLVYAEYDAVETSSGLVLQRLTLLATPE